jgi:hypothetical protein
LGKIFKENQGTQMNKGKQRTIYKPKGENLRFGLEKDRDRERLQT